MNKRRNALSIMCRLFKVIGSFSLILILAVINGTIGNLLGNGVLIFGSLGVAKLTDPNLVKMSYGLIITLTILSGLLKGFLKYAEQYSNHFIAFKILAILRDKIFKKLRELAPANMLDKKKGSIVSLVTSDIETLEVFYAHTISPICIAFLTSLFMFLFVGFVSNFVVSSVLLLGYVLIGVILPIISSKVYSKKGVEYRKEFSTFCANYLDYIKGRDEIVLNNKQEEFIKKIDSKSTSLLNTNKAIKARSSILLAITNLIVTLTIITVLFLSIYYYKIGSISLGAIAIVTISITGSFGPTLSLAVLPQNLTQTLASGNRLINLLEEEPRVKDITDGKDFEFEDLKINHLNFKYDENNILTDINLQVKKGEIIGIKGESGSGKSTILSLLLRFYNIDNNTILYNDIDINNINTKSLRNNVTMVSQYTYLFSDTILNNLKVAKPDASIDEIKEACKKASIDEFIESLPQKYDTKISNDVENISAGEKQRIGLARAFLSNAKLILLDEPTSNVDSLNEKIILKSLKDYKENHAIILVSHRKSSMSICDKIYNIEDGKMF